MNIKNFVSMMRNAQKCGINTLGELALYKRLNLLKTNAELYNQLFLDAIYSE